MMAQYRLPNSTDGKVVQLDAERVFTQADLDVFNNDINDYNSWCDGNTVPGVSFNKIAEDIVTEVSGYTGGIISVPINYDGSTVQGSITFYNASTGAFEQVGADGVGSSKELVENGDFSDGLNGYQTIGDVSVVNEIAHVESASYLIVEKDIIKKEHRYKIEVDISVISGNILPTVFTMSNYYGADLTSYGNLSVGPDSSMIITSTNDNKYIAIKEARAVGGIMGCDNFSVKEALPLSTHYDLTDGTYGIVIVLATASFSEDDLAFFTSMPERALQWALGTIAVPSGLTFGPDDKCYAATEESGDILWELSEVDSIQITGSYTRNIRTASGVQTMRLELNDAGVPQSVITNHQIRFRAQGDYVDTGIAIDGSQTDFTMFMGFTLPLVDTGVNQMLVNSGAGLNKLAIMHTTGNPLNELKAQIGQFIQSMTFDETNPIHAMAARYNHSTSQLEVAIDGEPFSAPFDIVFDGATDNILFGVSSTEGHTPFNGYIGEGVLSATRESENAWFAFWERVNNNYCPQPEGELFQNRNFDCGAAYWDLDPNYGGNIIDNGDGTVTLEATSSIPVGDLGSLFTLPSTTIDASIPALLALSTSSLDASPSLTTT